MRSGGERGGRRRPGGQGRAGLRVALPRGVRGGLLDRPGRHRPKHRKGGNFSKILSKFCQNFAKIWQIFINLYKSLHPI